MARASSLVVVAVLGLAATSSTVAAAPPSIEARGTEVRISGTEVVFVQDPANAEGNVPFFETVMELQDDVSGLAGAASKIPLMESAAADQAMQIKALTDTLTKTQQDAKESKSALESTILKLEKTVNDMAAKLNAVTKCADGDVHSDGECVSPIPTCDLKDLVVSNGEMVLSSDDHEAIAGAKAVAKCKPTYAFYGPPAICKTDGTWNDATDRVCKACPAGCATCTETECLSCTDTKKIINADKNACIDGSSTCRELGVTKSGWYKLTTKGILGEDTKTVRAYCHVVGKAIHTSITCGELSSDGECLITPRSSQDNTCKRHGYGLYPLRSPQHMKSAFDIFGSTFFKVAPIVRGTMWKAGEMDNCVMASKDFLGKGLTPCTGWKAEDGKDFYANGASSSTLRRDGSTYTTPSGDYTPGCFLDLTLYSGDRSQVNDHSCKYVAEKYICSTSDYDA